MAASPEAAGAAADPLLINYMYYLFIYLIIYVFVVCAHTCSHATAHMEMSEQVL